MTNYIRDWVEKRLSPERFQHTLRVAGLATDMAVHWKIDKDKAELAGLLHDCAREMPLEDMLAIMDKSDQPIYEYQKYKPALLHAPAAAELIQIELGITDEEVINAVCFHTTGRPGMGLLEKIIYLADYTEPARKFKGVERVRELLYRDLDLAMKYALDQTLIYVIKRGLIICPNTLEARNHLYLQDCQTRRK
jgi:predicted HD superfamily hydrolase involved in NAD metabolism